VFVEQAMKRLAVDARLTRRLRHVAAFAPQQFRHVGGLELAYPTLLGFLQGQPAGDLAGGRDAPPARRRRGRKRALGTRVPMTLPGAINQRWSLDFVADALSDGRRFRILCVVDDFSRECLATVVDTSLGGVRVVRELERLATERALPQIVVSDNGTELTSGAVLRWATGRLQWHYIEPGKPVQNASWNRSTASSATSASTSTCSSRSPKRARPSRRGGSTTITAGRTQAWAP
jgi:Integrase core domain